MRTRACLYAWSLSLPLPPPHTLSLSLSPSLPLSLLLPFLPLRLSFSMRGTGKRSSAARWRPKCRRRQRRQIVCWVSWGLNVRFVSLSSIFSRSLTRAGARTLLYECQQCLTRMLWSCFLPLSSQDDALRWSSSKQDDNTWKAFLGVRWVYLRWCGMDPFLLPHVFYPGSSVFLNSNGVGQTIGVVQTWSSLLKFVLPLSLGAWREAETCYRHELEAQKGEEDSRGKTET